jgi:antitoxin (DNA-binding transcriptional repressor) of toxin-antitoxin stability system
MEQVGMRQLRHRLREYLARVEGGEGFEVTLFGRAVAELRPLRASGSTIAQLVAEGRVSPPLNPDTTQLPKRYPVITGTTATDALLAERRSDRR